MHQTKIDARIKIQSVEWESQSERDGVVWQHFQSRVEVQVWSGWQNRRLSGTVRHCMTRDNSKQWTLPDDASPLCDQSDDDLSEVLGGTMFVLLRDQVLAAACEAASLVKRK